MDAKQYIRNKFKTDGELGYLPEVALENVIRDPRLKIELLPPPLRFEWHKGLFNTNWNVVDVLAQPPTVVGTFTDQARAITYAKWQNSLETE